MPDNAYAVGIYIHLIFFTVDVCGWTLNKYYTVENVMPSTIITNGWNPQNDFVV